MARNPASDEEKACGKFLINFLNCKLKPSNLSELINKCLVFMEAYLRYNRDGWSGIKIISTFRELIQSTEPSYIDNFINPYFQYRKLGGEDAYRYKNLDNSRKAKIDRLRRKITESKRIDWGSDNETIHHQLLFYIDFAMFRKNLRKVFDSIIAGKTLEQIQTETFIGDFITRLKSEYLDLGNQIIIVGNQIKITNLITKITNDKVSPSSFLNGYLIPSLSFCLIQIFRDPKNVDRLAKCQYPLCKKYLFSETLHKRKFCDQICKAKCQHLKRDSVEWAKYMQDYREPIRKAQIIEKHELEIKRIMKDSGLGREEIEEMLEEDEKM